MMDSSATAGQPARPEIGRDNALVHLGALGQAGFLRVLGDHAVERLHVLQRAAHHDGVADADAVVGEDADAGAGIGHGAKLGELLAGQAHGDGADGAHIDPAGFAAQGVDLLHNAGGVGNG